VHERKLLNRILVSISIKTLPSIIGFPDPHESWCNALPEPEYSIPLRTGHPFTPMAGADSYCTNIVLIHEFGNFCSFASLLFERASMIL
jgi:hypothetical protein